MSKIIRQKHCDGNKSLAVLQSYAVRSFYTNVRPKHHLYPALAYTAQVEQHAIVLHLILYGIHTHLILPQIDDVTLKHTPS